MPFIDENDLLDLHKDIEKSQIINERLLNQISHKSKSQKRLRIQRNLFGAIAFILVFLATIAFTYYSGMRTSNDMRLKESLVYAIDSINLFKARVESLKSQNEELSLVKEFYLAKQFLEKDKIYSVQIKSFVDKNVILSSEALANTMFVKANPYYTYSLGNFKTLDEAVKLKKELVSLGFDDAFIASYKNGERLKIESAN